MGNTAVRDSLVVILCCANWMLHEGLTVNAVHSMHSMQAPRRLQPVAYVLQPSSVILVPLVSLYIARSSHHHSYKPCCWLLFPPCHTPLSAPPFPCQVGVRYSSPVFTAGAAFAPAPAPGAITSAWIVSRLKGVTFGYKLLPDAPGLSLGAVPPGSGRLGETLQRGQQWLMSNGSLAVAYTPPAGVAGGAAGG